MLGTPGRGGGVRRAGLPVRSRARGAGAGGHPCGGSVGAGVRGERGFLCGLVHAFWRLSRGIPLEGRPALRMPDQYPSFGLADLRDLRCGRQALRTLRPALRRPGQYLSFGVADWESPGFRFIWWSPSPDKRSMDRKRLACVSCIGVALARPLNALNLRRVEQAADTEPAILRTRGVGAGGGHRTHCDG